jgi:hypothetical protein
VRVRASSEEINPFRTSSASDSSSVIDPWRLVMVIS